MYRFMGIYREQLWFDSPNLAACFLAMLIMLCTGLFLSLIKRESIYCKLASIIPAVVAVAGQFLLACTYSRGGYVAMAAGLLVLLWATRSKWLFGFAGTFVAFLFVIENGVTRIGTMSNIAEGSIMNRLLLWRGGMALIADHWATGMRVSFKIGPEYAKWFQPLWLNENYNSLINDFLTVTCNWGIFVSGGILLGVAFVFFWGFRIQRKINSGLLGGILAGIVVFMVCGLFSTMFMEPLLLYSCAAMLLIVLVWCVMATWRRHISWRWGNIRIPLAAVMSFCLLFVIACKVIRSHFPYTYATVTIGDTERFDVTISTPDFRRNTVVCVYDDNNDDGRAAIREVVRPLLEMGIKVYCTEVDSGFAGLHKTEKLLEFALKDTDNKPVIILAYGLAGKQLFIAAAKNNSSGIEEIIIHDIPETWPFDEISPMMFADDLNIPALFLRDQSELSNGLQEEMRSRGKQVSEYILNPGTTLPQALSSVLPESNQHKRIQIYLFERAGCDHCAQLEEILKTVPAPIAKKIHISRFSVDHSNNKVRLAAFAKLYNGEYNSTLPTPVIFFADKMFCGEDAVNKVFPELCTLIQSDPPLPTTLTPTKEQLSEAESMVVKRFCALPVIAIIAAGLIDGVNPCIFTGLIFFISLLTMAHFSRAVLLRTGIIYCVACYVTYFLMGSGLLGALSAVSDIQYVSALLYIIMAIFLVALSFFRFATLSDSEETRRPNLFC